MLQLGQVESLEEVLFLAEQKHSMSQKGGLNPSPYRAACPHTTPQELPALEIKTSSTWVRLVGRS